MVWESHTTSTGQVRLGHVPANSLGTEFFMPLGLPFYDLFCFPYLFFITNYHFPDLFCYKRITKMDPRFNIWKSVSVCLFGYR